MLTKDEVQQLMDQMSGSSKLMAKLTYGCGLRLRECLRLRIQDRLEHRDPKTTRRIYTHLMGKNRFGIKSPLDITAVRLSFRKNGLSHYNFIKYCPLKGVRDLKSDSIRPTPVAQAQIVRKETGRESRKHRIRPSHGLFAQAAIPSLCPAVSRKFPRSFFQMLRPISLHGLCAVNLQAEPSGH